MADEPTPQKVKEAEKEKIKQEEPKKGIKASAKVKKLIEEIESLTVLELSEVVKALEDKFGPPQVAPLSVAPSGQAAQQGIQPEETKADEGQTAFNVILTSVGENKISVIKAVREINQTLGLKEAKDLVEAAPKEVLNAVNKETAEEAKKKLETAGATVELK